MTSEILIDEDNDDAFSLLKIIEHHDSRTVDIPKKLHDQIQEMIQRTSFSSVEEYCLSKIRLELSRDTQYSPEYTHQIRQYLKRIAHP